MTGYILGLLILMYVMAKKTVKVEGLDDTIKRLRALGKGLDPKKVHDLMEKAANPIISQVQTGLITHNLNPTAWGMITNSDPKYISSDGVAIRIGTNFKDVHGNLVNFMEYGTAPRYTKDGVFRGEVTGKKVIRPVLDMGKDSMKKTVADGIKKGYEKLIKDNGF